MSTDYKSALSQELQALVETGGPPYTDFFNIFRYHLGWTDAQGNPAFSDPGKQIRPLLCLLSCQALSGTWENALPAAAAVELIHNFSLIHDDIEDDSAERRGRLAVWKVWGLPQGVNAGDAMFALAHSSLDRLNASVPAERQLAIRRTFNRATLQLTQGQYLDMSFERADQVDLEQYLEMVGGKTASLISACCEIGARIATADEKLIAQFAAYGRNLGIAFQITDDILGLWGDPAVTGKSARTDLLNRKKSYPVLAAMHSECGTELRALYAKPDWSEDDIVAVETILNKVQARVQATAKAQSYARHAQDALTATHLENPATQQLRDLITQIVSRDK